MHMVKTHVCTYIHTYTYIHIHIHIHIHVYVCAYSCVQIHIYIHIHTHVAPRIVLQYPGRTPLSEHESSGASRYQLPAARAPQAPVRTLNLKDQMNHKIQAIYHILLKLRYGISTVNPFKGHLVQKEQGGPALPQRSWEKSWPAEAKLEETPNTRIWKL